MQLAPYFGQLARYHAWATHKLLTQDLAALSDDEWHRDLRLFFGSVHRTVNHLLVTDDIWFARLAHGDTAFRLPLDAELHTERAAVIGALRAAAERWAPWIESMDPAQVDAELAYQRSDGKAVRLPWALALGHAFNHATHHRGQITAAMTALGHPGPSLDWARLLQDPSSQQT